MGSRKMTIGIRLLSMALLLQGMSAFAGAVGSDSHLSLHPDRQNPKEWFLRLTASGGLASLSSNNPQESAARDSGGYGKNFFGGLAVEGQYGLNFGMEVEGFAGKGSTNSTTTADKVTGTLTSRDRSLSQRGFMIDAQFRTPVTNFAREWGLHGGIGFGAMGVTENAPASALGAVSDSTLKLSGPYLTAGVEVRAIAEIALGVDYAFSVFASSKRTNTGGTDVAYDGGRFDRLRLNASYLLTPDYRVGLNYTRRVVLGSTAGVDDSELSNQFLATLIVIL